MKPNDTYTYLPRQAMIPDFVSLAKCYQPILGAEASLLYHYLWAFYDQGQERHPFSQILNHLNVGMPVFERSLGLLTAMKLLDMYQEELGYILVLQAPLSITAFLQEDLYRSLLLKKIGEPALLLLESQLPRGEKVGRTFTEAFDMTGQPLYTSGPSVTFDMVAFERLMGRDQLVYQDQAQDRIALHHLAEEQGWTWFEAYQVAKTTAVEGRISTLRMQQFQLQDKTSTSSLSQQEIAVVRECQSKKPLEFLTLLKRQKRATVTASEKKCLLALASLGLLDEVINVIVFYTLSRLDTANLKESFALKVGNDFSYKQIRTAEAAVIVLREPPAKKSKKVSSITSNVPEWSKQEIQTKTTAEGQARLEALRRQMQENEGNGGSR